MIAIVRKVISMRLIPVIFSAGFLLLPAAAMAQQIGPITPIGATTVPAFLRGCARDRNGCQLAVGSALLDKINIVDGAPEICTPTGSDIGQPVTDWLRQHTEMQNLPAEDAIFAALKALYPCGRPQTVIAAQ
jgi:hypothetical protein